MLAKYARAIKIMRELPVRPGSSISSNGVNTSARHRHPGRIRDGAWAGLTRTVPEDCDDVPRRPERFILPWRTAMHWKSIVPFALLALAVPGGSFTTAQDKTAQDPKREPDRLAIDQLTKDLIQAFDKWDAAALAAQWTEDGEFIRNGGEPVRGRAAIQKGYIEFFKTLKGKPKLEIQAD